MEKKIGEIFEYKGLKLVVKEDMSLCGCENCIGELSYCDDICIKYKCVRRKDRKSVIFAEVKE